MSRQDPSAGRMRQFDPGVVFSPAPSPAPPSAGSTDPFAMFDDPATNYLTGIIRNQIGSLQNTGPDPTTSGVLSFLGGRLGALASAPPVSFNVDNSLMGDFVTEGRKRIEELNQAPFTAQEEQALKTRTRNDVAMQRDQAKQRLMEDAARRGLGKSSGIIGQEVSNLEGQTTAQDAKNQNDLMLWIAQQGQDRKNQAASIAQQLAAMGQSQAQLGLQAQTAAASVNQNRDAMALNVANQLAAIAAQQRGEARANRQDVLSLATLLADLPVQRLQLANQILNGNAPSVPSLFGEVNTLNTAQQNAQQAQQAQNAQFINALAQYAGYYGNRG